MKCYIKTFFNLTSTCFTLWTLKKKINYEQCVATYLDPKNKKIKKGENAEIVCENMLNI